MVPTAFLQPLRAGWNLFERSRIFDNSQMLCELPKKAAISPTLRVEAELGEDLERF
jgi:hypothetical protein